MEIYLKPPMRALIGIIALGLFASHAPCHSKQVFEASGNPVFEGADPDVAVVGNEYWIYPTYRGGLWENQFYAYSSPDLKKWTLHGPILDFKDVKWIGDDGAPRHAAWAPGIFQKAGKYYLYFAVGPQGQTPSRVGVAVGTSPGGHFTDSGKVLLTGGKDFEAIDPMVFSDPKSGKVYLYAGGSAGAKLRVFELAPDCISIAKEDEVQTPLAFTEGAFMHYRNGTYYLSYSAGRWSDYTYSVHYSTSSSPTGPWTYQGPILQSSRDHWGAGHHSFVCNPSTGQWYIVYHRWNAVRALGKQPPNRMVCIDKIAYDKDGLIEPVIMTDAGVPLSPIK